jgi:hypothetical protein
MRNIHKMRTWAERAFGSDTTGLQELWVRRQGLRFDGNGRRARYRSPFVYAFERLQLPLKHESLTLPILLPKRCRALQSRPTCLPELPRRARFRARPVFARGFRLPFPCFRRRLLVGTSGKFCLHSANS